MTEVLSKPLMAAALGFALGVTMLIPAIMVSRWMDRWSFETRLMLIFGSTAGGLMVAFFALVTFRHYVPATLGHFGISLVVGYTVMLSVLAVTAWVRAVKPQMPQSPDDGETRS